MLLSVPVQVIDWNDPAVLMRLSSLMHSCAYVPQRDGKFLSPPHTSNTTFKLEQQNSAHLYISGMRRIFVFNSTPIRSGSSKVCYKYKYKIKTYNAPYVTRVIRRRGNNLGLTRYDIE